MLELTPAVLLSLGPVPAMGLARFKQESAWRPAPVRQMARAVFLGEQEPVTTGLLDRVIGGWYEADCQWVGGAPDPDALGQALRQAREGALSAALLEEVRAIPGYAVRIREHRESFAPEVCLLADPAAASEQSFCDLLEALQQSYGRPVTLAMAMPAPHDKGWEAARQLVFRLLGTYGPETLRRIWLISREQEHGELLTPIDLADALGHFCHLFAYSGWAADPVLSHLLFGGAPDRLATFGVRGYRFQTSAAVRRLLIDEAGSTIRAMLDAADDGPAFDLAASVAERRDGARRSAPPLPPPDQTSTDAAVWRTACKLWWEPGVEEHVRAMVRLDFDLTAAPRQPRAAERWLRRVIAGVRRQQAEMERPAPPPDLEPAFRRLREANRGLPWGSLLLKGIIATVAATAFTWTFFPPGYAPAAAVILAACWSLLMLALFILNRREQGRALAAVRAEARNWGEARLDALTYWRALEELERLAQDAGAALADALQESARLEEALALLEQEAAVPHLPPAATAVSVPVDGHLSVTLRRLAPEELQGAPSALVQRLLERGGPAIDGGGAPLTEAMQADARSVPLLMPVRAIEPAEGDPLHIRRLVLAGSDPFLLLRCIVTRTFGLPGSARLDPILAGRDDR